MRWIGKAESDVVLFVVVPSAASPWFGASFAIKGQNIVGLGSESRLMGEAAQRCDGQFCSFMRAVTLALAPGHQSRSLCSRGPYAQAYQNSRERKAELPSWLHRYNWHRPHTGIDGKTPIIDLAGGHALDPVHLPPL